MSHMSRVQAKPLHRTTTTTSEGQIVTVRVMVEVSEAVYDDYEEQAIARGIPVERLMAERLTRARAQVHDALVFTAEQKKRLDKAIGHTVSDAEGALIRLDNFCKLEVGDVTVPLEPRLILRITSRAKAMRQTFSQCLQKEVIGALRRFTGLDPA